MNLFSRLFGKAPSPATKALKSAPGRPSSVDIPSIQNDAGLRVQAADGLEYGDALLAAASDVASPPQQRAAQQRLAELIDAGSIEFSVFARQARNQARNQTRDQVMLLAVAALTRDPANLQQAADSIDDPDFFFDLATQGPATRLRQLAAERIEDPAQLRRLLKSARGKDKNVFKIAKRKCDAINAQHRQAAQIQADIVALAEAIERHGYKPFDGAFVATLEHFSSQWSAVAAQAPAEVAAKVAQAMERSHQTISNHLRTVAAQAAQASAIENADTQRRLALAEMRDLLLSVYLAEQMDSEAHNAVAGQVARWTQRWQDVARYRSASSMQAGDFESLCAAVSRLLQLVSQHGTLRRLTEKLRAASPEADVADDYRALQDMIATRDLLTQVEPPEEILAAEALLQEYQKSRAERQAAAAVALRQLGGLIRRANRALDEGKSSQAAGIRRSIAAAVLETQPLPGYLSGQLEQLDRRLGELQDWKSYVVAPKRADLIEQMESLVGAEEDPEALAERIKRLQDEWKAISKGGAAQSEEDWERFHRAAQAAYQPCREHFAAQARIREENLGRRKELVAELARYESATDWDDADWKDVVRRLRIARQNWRSFSPTERAATKPVQDEFDALLNRIQVRVEAQYAANIQRKQSLTQQAQRLLQESDTRKAIDEIKRLQALWKAVGLVPHLEDQKLWGAFRQHCDAVYQRSQHEYTQHVAGLAVNKAKALELCSEVERLAEVSGAALFEGASRIRQLREEFAALDGLSRADAGELNRRFERAVERFDFEVAQQRLRDESRRWDNLFAACNEVRLLHLAAIESSDTDGDAGVQALRESVRSFIDGVQQWPKGGVQAIEARLAASPSPDFAANETVLRTLCIRAEILTDTPTPPADQSLRRNHQLQSLVQGLGRPAGTTREQLEAMVFEWIGAGPLPTAAYMELLQRFRQCWMRGREK